MLNKANNALHFELDPSWQLNSFSLIRLRTHFNSNEKQLIYYLLDTYVLHIKVVNTPIQHIGHVRAIHFQQFIGRYCFQHSA